MLTNAPRVDTGAEWFSMIIGYLKVKSLALWLSLHPESSYEQFEAAWPALLDQMMGSATRTAIGELEKLCQITFN